MIYLNRRATYLGTYGSAESYERYWQLVSQHCTTDAKHPPALKNNEPISVAALVERYLAFADDYYGAENEYLSTIKAAVAPLLQLHASTAVSRFGPKALKLVRAHRINQGRRNQGRRNQGKQSDDAPPTWKPIARVYINKLIRIVVGVFQWGVAEELVPVQVWQALKAVKGLRKGKAVKTRECKRVKPVPSEHVDAVVKVVSPEIAAMIRLQTLTAMRPDEVTVMRPCDLNMSGEVWAYTLGDRSQGGVGHKTDHLEGEGDKFVCLGRRAQQVIKPFLAGCRPGEFLFSPKRAARRRYPRGNGGIKPSERYNDDTYCRAVKRGCERAGVPIWTPNRLRHNRATVIREEFGLEAAQAVLDHRSIGTTQIYAEKQDRLKREVARKIG